MALQKNITVTTEFGSDVVIQNSYIKVARVFGDKSEMTADVEISTGKEGKFVQRRTYGFAYNVAGSNPFQQAYFYLKSLPEFSDATDC